jgi:2-polyprenyl-6-methoxyphenol hydroxylase-like FAD-dependent oxidoreductase
MTEHEAIVVGAGIGGLTAAAALRRIGWNVRVLERARELKPAGGALSLMSNAVLALRTLGIDLKLEENAEILYDLHFVTTRGRPIRTLHFADLCSRLGAPSFGITRSDLQQLLLREIGDCPIELRAAVAGFAPDGDGVRVGLADGRTLRADALIGADGFHSAVRRQLAGPEVARETGYVCWVATPLFAHPNMPAGYAAHYWGRGRRFGLANIGKGRAYWWGTKNMPAPRARDWPGDKQEIADTYAGWAPEVVAAIAETPAAEITAFPAQDRPFREQWGRGPVTLLGDAAHPMMTSLGQGAALAMEDAVVLAHHLAGATDVPAALRAYEDARRPRARKVVETAHSMSKMEQAESPLKLLARNAFFRLAPASALEKQNAELLDFDATASVRT